MTMPRIYISMGSNMERKRHMRQALDALTGEFSDVQVSPVYESAAAGFSGPPFYNLVTSVQTSRPLPLVVAALRAIEDRCGRSRKGPKFGPRTMDLDLLTYGDFIGTAAGVQLPRPEIAAYSFILRPLAELSPQGRHPVSGRSWQELWQAYGGREEPPLRPVQL